MSSLSDAVWSCRHRNHARHIGNDIYTPYSPGTAVVEDIQYEYNIPMSKDEQKEVCYFGVRVWYTRMSDHGLLGAQSFGVSVWAGSYRGLALNNHVSITAWRNTLVSLRLDPRLSYLELQLMWLHPPVIAPFCGLERLAKYRHFSQLPGYLTHKVM